MIRMPLKFALPAAVTLLIAMTPAPAAIPVECNNRIVDAHDKWPPLAPGCRRLSCNPMYEEAKDDKGTYCLRRLGCGIYCKPKPPG